MTVFTGYINTNHAHVNKWTLVCFSPEIYMNIQGLMWMKVFIPANQKPYLIPAV